MHPSTALALRYCGQCCPGRLAILYKVNMRIFSTLKFRAKQLARKFLKEMGIPIHKSIAPASANAFNIFLTPEALDINEAAQQHLASLMLDLEHQRVLEVGAGIGLHTGFFEDHGCSI